MIGSIAILVGTSATINGAILEPRTCLEVCCAHIAWFYCGYDDVSIFIVIRMINGDRIRVNYDPEDARLVDEMLEKIEECVNKGDENGK